MFEKYFQSSLDFEEACHKLLKMNLKPGHEVELCHMILGKIVAVRKFATDNQHRSLSDCCAQQRTYEKFFGLLAQRFCQLNRSYVDPFQNIFISTYKTVHRLEIGKLRNAAKLFAHLLHTDAITWEVLEAIRLNEHETTSSSRIFIKILFQASRAHPLRIK
jgi:pre-mRNA-splicing factor CWC22